MAPLPSVSPYTQWEAKDLNSFGPRAVGIVSLVYQLISTPIYLLGECHLAVLSLLLRQSRKRHPFLSRVMFDSGLQYVGIAPILLLVITWFTRNGTIDLMFSTLMLIISIACIVGLFQVGNSVGNLAIMTALGVFVSPYLLYWTSYETLRTLCFILSNMLVFGMIALWWMLRIHYICLEAPNFFDKEQQLHQTSTQKESGARKASWETGVCDRSIRMNWSNYTLICYTLCRTGMFSMADFNLDLPGSMSSDTLLLNKLNLSAIEKCTALTALGAVWFVDMLKRSNLVLIVLASCDFVFAAAMLAVLAYLPAEPAAPLEMGGGQQKTNHFFLTSLPTSMITDGVLLWAALAMAADNPTRAPSPLAPKMPQSITLPKQIPTSLVEEPVRTSTKRSTRRSGTRIKDQPIVPTRIQ